MTDLRSLYLFGADISPDEGWRLVRWCMDLGADDFTLDGIATDGGARTEFDLFDRLADPFRETSESRPHMGGEKNPSLWALNDTTLDALKVAFPLGIFDYDFSQDAWFEDLVLYRRGKLMLGIITHENEGKLCVTPAEAEAFHAAGFRSRGAPEWGWR